MKTATLSVSNMHSHGDLFPNLLRARHEWFIEHNNWKLPNTEGMEFDQYDTPAARWIVVFDEVGQILAGNRMLPTTAKCGMYTYMIRDAQKGLLETIPETLLYEDAPVSDSVWESSRLFVSHHVPLAERRPVYFRLVRELMNTAREVGATSVLTLLNANWPLWAPRVGIDMTAMGPVMVIEGEKNQVVSMNLTSTMH